MSIQATLYEGDSGIISNYASQMFFNLSSLSHSQNPPASGDSLMNANDTDLSDWS